MTGSPAIIASSAGSEKPSANEGIASTVAVEYSSRISSSSTQDLSSTQSCIPVSSTTATSGSSPWLPVTTTLGRTAGSTSGRARMSDGQFLWGRRLPVASTSGPFSEARVRSTPGVGLPARGTRSMRSAGTWRYRMMASRDSSLMVRMRVALRAVSRSIILTGSV